jgi:hypothetical protein
MALLALGGMSLLFKTLFGGLICLSAGGRKGQPCPSARLPIGVQVAPINKQYANTHASAMSVHHVASTAGCWPGLWVGPSPVPQAYPAAAPVDPAPKQRRNRSAIAARATSHGTQR